MRKFVASLLLLGLILMSAYTAGMLQKHHAMVHALLLETREAVYDTNHDGDVNCLDYATTFKWLWDKKYPKYKYRCELVRNYNEGTGMNHLFARVKCDAYLGWTNVETWTDYIYIYDIETIWRDKYNPVYNYYGETSYWMHEANYW